MPTWPTSLPDKPLIDAYQETRQNGTVRTQMDAGPPKVRRRFTATITKFDARFLMDDAQIDTLESFFENDLDGGALRFDYDHPRKGTTLSFRFREPYTVVAIGADLYEVKCPFEVLP